MPNRELRSCFKCSFRYPRAYAKFMTYQLSRVKRPSAVVEYSEVYDEASKARNRETYEEPLHTQQPQQYMASSGRKIFRAVPAFN